MPDSTNLEQIQEQKAQESHAAFKRGAVRNALIALDLAYNGVAEDYLTLVVQLRDVLEKELATLTAPASRPETLVGAAHAGAFCQACCAGQYRRGFLVDVSGLAPRLCALARLGCHGRVDRNDSPVANESLDVGNMGVSRPHSA